MTTYPHLMPANTTTATPVPEIGADHAEVLTRKEVTPMSLFDLDGRPQRRADLDRLVALERLKQRRRAQAHIRNVHSQLWGIRANR